MSLNLIENQIILDQKSARYFQLKTIINNDKPHVHFYGGNGFVAGVYQPLLELLDINFNVSSLAMRGYWFDKPDVTGKEKSLNREQDADVLIEYLEKTARSRYDQPVIGIGHSQGATATAMAAAKRPDLFSALYLIEPVTFPNTKKLFYDLMPRFIKMHNEPFKSTLKKQIHWASVDDYYQHLRSNRAYKRINDEHLYIYAKNSLVENSQGDLELFFAPNQELANYLGKSPHIDKALKVINQTALPYQLIIGKPSMFASEKVRQTWQSFVPKERVTILPEYGHLLPIEAPTRVAEQIIHLSQ